MGLYKRGKVWWISTDPIDKVRRSTGCTSKKAAQAWVEHRQLTAANPAYAAANEARLGDWIARVVKSTERQDSERTQVYRRQKLGHAIRIWGADRPLADVTPRAIDEYVEQRRNEDVTDHTISKEVGLLIGVLRAAKRAGQYAGELDALRPSALKAGYKPRERALTPAELTALLTELEPERGALVAICVGLGLRMGEAYGLLPTDFEGDVCHVRGTKTAGSRRDVPILTIFRSLVEAARPYLPLRRWPNQRRDILAACKRAGIDPCSTNDFRRTFASWQIGSGVDRDVVRRFMGHTTTTMVDRVYGRPTSEALRDLAESRLLLAAPKALESATCTDSAHCFAACDGKPQKTGANYESRTRDLRFTKPERSPRYSGRNALSPAKTPVASGEHRPETVGDGTGLSQSGWRMALGFAALDMGVLS